jgi:hypothetical protein
LQYDTLQKKMKFVFQFLVITGNYWFCIEKLKNFIKRNRMRNYETYNKNNTMRSLKKRIMLPIRARRNVKIAQERKDSSCKSEILNSLIR